MSLAPSFLCLSVFQLLVIVFLTQFGHFCRGTARTLEACRLFFTSLDTDLHVPVDCSLSQLGSCTASFHRLGTGNLPEHLLFVFLYVDDTGDKVFTSRSCEFRCEGGVESPFMRWRCWSTLSFLSVDGANNKQWSSPDLILWRILRAQGELRCCCPLCEVAMGAHAGRNTGFTDVLSQGNGSVRVA